MTVILWATWWTQINVNADHISHGVLEGLWGSDGQGFSQLHFEAVHIYVQTFILTELEDRLLLALPVCMKLDLLGSLFCL